MNNASANKQTTPTVHGGAKETETISCRNSTTWCGSCKDEFLNTALSYASRGWPVFPCRPRGKEPLTDHGFKDATTDVETIRAWWQKWPNANVAIPTGQATFVVLDVDVRAGGDDALRDLIARYGPLPDTPTVITGGGGTHYYFKPPATPLRCSRLADGLEIKADGGYVVAPPSVHPSGRAYAWELSSHYEDVPLADLPAWLLELAQPRVELRSDGHEQPTAVDLLAELPKAAAALKRLKPQRCDNYDDWLAVGMALSELGDAGLALWDEWSRGSRKYQPGVCAEKWKTFEPGHGLTLASLYFWAAQDELEKKQTTAEPDQSTELRLEDLAIGSDAWYAKLMSELLKRRLCYTPAWGWLAWDGKRWQRDNGRARIAALQELTNWIARAATQETNADKRKELFQAAARIQNRARLDNALAIAQGWLLESTECFDQQAHLLNAANGVVDLRTGELLPHDPLLRLTQITTQPYDSAADCPGFRAFLSEIFANNDRLIAYLQRLLGYGLLGHNHERLFVIFWGRGHNGKTTLINILAGILGDYVHEARPESFETLRPGEVRARNDLAKLYNARIVTMNESRESSRLDPALVKQVTGGDPVTARFLYREDFTFRPMFLPILRTNFKPHLPGGDPALWDRMRLVPFTVHIPPERRVKGLAEHLVQREGTGILAWLVRGCLEYHRAGLNDPPEVLKATEEYRGETDPIWAFVQERCVISENAREEVGKLYQAYTLWCDEQGIEPKSKQAFGRTLSNLGFESRRGDLRLRIGIQLK